MKHTKRRRNQSTLAGALLFIKAARAIVHISLTLGSAFRSEGLTATRWSLLVCSPGSRRRKPWSGCATPQWTWSFEVHAEQKSCHFAKPPPTAERVSYQVVDTEVSEEGWQSGAIRIRDREWRRISLLRRFEPDASGSVSTPVVISHVQNVDVRTEFNSTRHHLGPRHYQSALPRTRTIPSSSRSWGRASGARTATTKRGVLR
jgi:hypothetical protein